MAGFDLQPSHETLESNLRLLSEKGYLGDLIGIGRGIGNILIQAHVITGQTEQQKDRKHVEEHQGLRVAPKSGKPVNVNIHYSAMTEFRDVHVVANGNQTEPTKNFIHSGMQLAEAGKPTSSINDLSLNTYKVSPDGISSRATGVIDIRNNALTPFSMTCVSKDDDSEQIKRTTWQEKDLAQLPENTGYVLEEIGDDLKPVPVVFGSTAAETAKILKKYLNTKHFVSIAATSILMPGSTYYIQTADQVE